MRRSTRGGERTLIISVLALLLTAYHGHIVAQDKPSPESLKGLKGVFLQVNADRGFQQRMEALVIQELRRARIRTVSENDWKLAGDVALLHLDVIISCERDSVSCGYSVVLKVGQHVQIPRGERPKVTASTWQNSYTGSQRKTQLGGLPDLLSVDAGTLVLEFVNDYRIANPISSRRARTPK